MKKCVFSIFAWFLFINIVFQDLQENFASSATNEFTIYSAAYGNPSHQPIVFIHGGPGHNSYDFELTTARNLTERGYYVIVYDQRGQGRSSHPRKISDVQVDPYKKYLDYDLTAFNYQDYAKDLMEIMKLHIPKSNSHRPILLGHSHGGVIAARFYSLFPNVVRAIILVSAPVNYFDLIRSIYKNCDGKFSEVNFKTLKNLLEMDINPKQFWESEYSFDTVKTVVDMFSVASKECKIYEPRILEAGAFDLWKSDPEGKIPKPNFNVQDSWSTPGFIANELYFLSDQSKILRENKNIFFGIYADFDGLLDLTSRRSIQELITTPDDRKRFITISGASHHLFWQAQTSFFDAIDSFVAQMK